MSLSVGFSKWRVQSEIGELSRTYHFSGLHAPDVTATLKLDCRLKSSVGGFIDSIFTLYIRPFRLLHDTPLVMGLVTTDQSNGGTFEVRACPVEGDPDTALFAVEGTQNVQKCLSAISSGKEMYFMLGNQTRPFVKLPLPNDGEFQRLYNETYERMTRAQDASSYGFYLKRFLRGIDALLDAATAKQRSFATALNDGSRRLTKTALDPFTRPKAATVGLTRAYSFPVKIDAMAERLKPRTPARAVAHAHNASRDGHYLKRLLRGVDALLDAAKTRQRSFAAAFMDGWRRLAKSALDKITRLKAATVGLTRAYSFRDKIAIMAERLKARTTARAVARTQYANRDGHYLKRRLRGVDGLLDAVAVRKRLFVTAFNEGRRRLAETALDTYSRLTANTFGLTWRYSFSEKIGAVVERLNPRIWRRDWVVFGLSLIPCIVIIVLLVGPSNIQSTSNSQPPSNSQPQSNSAASPAGPTPATANVNANVKTQAETVAYVGSLADATNKEPLKLRQTSALPEIHRVTHAIGEVGTLKQGFIGCRESWENDGLLKLESKAFGNECDVHLPAGTEVIVANIRANNNICVRFPDGIVCYWATGDVLKSPKLLPTTPTEVHPIKARQAKARPAIRRSEEDDGLSFLR